MAQRRLGTPKHTTRAGVIARLRRSSQTVDELAGALGLTDNAIRLHLAALEQEGVVRASGRRRGPGAGKPATLYELDPSAEVGMSRAYVPVLAALIEQLASRLAPAKMRALMRQVGRRLVRSSPAAAGDLRERAGVALELVEALGGAASLEACPAGITLRGHGCPLAAAVAASPAVCEAVRVLLSEVTSAQVRERCEHGERPRCVFLLREA